MYVKAIQGIEMGYFALLPPKTAGMVRRFVEVERLRFYLRPPRYCNSMYSMCIWSLQASTVPKVHCGIPDCASLHSPCWMYRAAQYWVVLLSQDETRESHSM
jgi:hypothetical protein